VNNVVSNCKFEPTIQTLGNNPSDFLDPTFFRGMVCDTTGMECDEATLAVAKTWDARFLKDRPTLDRSGAPVVLLQANKDDLVPEYIVGCGIDKIRGDLGANPAMFSVCADNGVDVVPGGQPAHELIESKYASWVMKWIKARTLGGADPGSCGNISESQLGATCDFGNLD
jgi:hypothetical protein